MKSNRTVWICLVTIASVAAVVAVTLNAFATPAPVMTIVPLASNQFSITITNGDPSASYELYWTPILNQPAFPWQLLIQGTLAQTNFTVNGSNSPIAFFQMRVGNDSDGDGVPNWMDADPNNPAIGALTVTINTPANGSIVQ